jgi:DNA primase
MRGGVTSEVIAEVRSRASIQEVISEHIVLKRAGKEYKGLCPFHNEKSPSFHVNTEKGIFKCFGCNEGGDVFAFVQKIKKLDFLDTVRDLAHKYNVPLIDSYEQRHEYDKRSQVLMLYQQASEYYSHLLNDPVEGKMARDYLGNRGITQDIIDRFKLGVASPAWDGLLRYLTESTKVAPQTLEEAGLVRSRAESSGHYDLFRNRLIIPICDDQGRVIAFGGRTLGDDQIKYLNSPETPVYTKGQHLYGFNLAKDSIKKKDAVIVVEGYFDVITSHLYGFDNTVATCGTALTEQQAKSLVRYTDSRRVYLAFDADEAGVRAIDKGFEPLNNIARGVGIDLRVIRVPGGKDPDECLRSSAENAGPAVYGEAVDQALPFVDYQLVKAMEGQDLKTHTGRIDAAKVVVPILAQIPSDVARSQYAQQWSGKLSIDEIALSADVNRHRREHNTAKRPQPRHAPASQAPPSGPRSHLLGSRGGMQSGYIDAERQLLALYLTTKQDYDRVNKLLADDLFLSAEHQRIKEAIYGIGSSFNNVEDLQQKLMDRLSPDPDALQAFVDVLLKVDEIRKQDAPVEILLKAFQLVILAEKLNRELATARALLPDLSEDEQATQQSKMMKLQQLRQAVQTFDGGQEDLDELKRKIKEVTGKP